MMEFDTQTVFGPKTASASRSEALKQLQTHPNFPKEGLVLDIEDKNGQWVAQIGTPKTAEFPPKSDDGGDEGAPAGPPVDDAGDEGEKPEPADEGGEEKSEGPPKAEGEHGEKGKKPSVEEAVLHLTDLVSQIADALGIGGGLGGLPGGGPEVPGDVPVPPAGPPGAGGPPGHGGGPAGPPAHAMKPGMAPPGTTPVGSPAFASTHPWANLIGKVATFKVTSDPTNQTAAEAWEELDALAVPVGYKATQVKPFNDESGNRRIKALVVAQNRL